VLEDAASSLLQLDPGFEKQRRPSSAKNDTSTAQEQLKAKGFLPIQWYGKCEADKVSMSTYPVPAGQGGMYGLVFDNTFSNHFSKTATFVLLTYPSNAPPHSTHHLQNLQGAPSGTSLSSLGKTQSPKLAAASDSVDSLQSHLAIGNSGSRGNSVMGRADSESGIALIIRGSCRRDGGSVDRDMHADSSLWISHHAHCRTTIVEIRRLSGVRSL